MSNGISLIPQNDSLMVGAAAKWEVFNPASDIWEKMRDDLANGEQLDERALVQVKMPAGGSTHWIVDEDATKELVGILCYAGRRGTLWPYEEIGREERPVLVTNDLRTAYRVGSEIGDLDEAVLEAAKNPDGSYRWQDLPYCQQSPDGGRMRAKETRRICLLREEDRLPIVVNVSAGSLWKINPFLTRLSKPVYRYVVGLGLERAEWQGIPYARVVPRVVGELSQEQGALIKGLYTTPLQEILGGGVAPNVVAIAESAVNPKRPGGAAPAPVDDGPKPF